MYRNAESCVRVNDFFSDDTLVQVGLHQGSVLSPLLFIKLLEALSREIRSECPEKLLYAYDLALVSETLDGLKVRLEAWNRNLIFQRKKTKLNINPVINDILSNVCDFEDKLSKYQCDFRKVYSARQCPILIIQKLRDTVDKWHKSCTAN